MNDVAWTVRRRGVDDDDLGAPEPERVVMYTFMPGSVRGNE